MMTEMLLKNVGSALTVNILDIYSNLVKKCNLFDPVIVAPMGHFL